jgi:hypothetical protein
VRKPRGRIGFSVPAPVSSMPMGGCRHETAVPDLEKQHDRSPARRRPESMARNLYRPSVYRLPWPDGSMPSDRAAFHNGIFTHLIVELARIHNQSTVKSKTPWYHAHDRSSDVGPSPLLVIGIQDGARKHGFLRLRIKKKTLYDSSGYLERTPILS